ncbi:hypothetical protein F2Q70_00036580 [Brassica cretica]|uniref:Uncharacterized protein n=1 Tax=Brassica cretica TaxID=69181 RepID=A0A8S9JSH0_BRACR|nr:hypothetical protein F2Q70_00036580 [Brassica cretica]
MVAIVILRQDENGNLYDQDGHLRNATCQKLDAQGNVIPDTDATGAAQPVEEAARPRALADYNHTLRIDAILGIPKISHPPGIWTSLRPAQYELGWSMNELGMEEDGTELNLYQEKDFHQLNGHEEHVGFGFERGQFEMVETKYFQPMK